MMILTSVSSWPKRNLLSSFQVRNDHRVPKFETFFFFFLLLSQKDGSLIIILGRTSYGALR